MEEEDFDRDSVDFIPPSIMVEEKVSDPRAQEIGADSLADSTYCYAFPFTHLTDPFIRNVMYDSMHPTV